MKRWFSPLLVVAALGSTAALAQELPQVDIYKSPTCDCCGKWIEHMRKAGFKVEAHVVTDVPGNRKKLGMPDKYGSCHTSKVAGYLLEGHVPAADVHRLLKEKPKAVGLASPGMPPGSPGMDIPNAPPYDVLLVQTDGTSKVFAKH
ncbi:DUF411 domain-containing protein [Propionivibrio soli]|uniref:DUF411 domain-containing protein n=1 Tax=Propionivibrio soli TaxID=2976531 RepID=UPI0021E811B0|nr:DUF411 domain-containing protein [Propionivibrio soli]